MEANDYQQQSARTLIDRPGFEIPDKGIMIVWYSIGLCGESGEVAELSKKGVFYQHGIDNDRFEKELGDVLWYVAGLCTILGFDMSEVMEKNIKKIWDRYPNGYSSSDSILRADVK